MTATTDFHERARGGAFLLGTFIKLPGLESIDLAAKAKFDFVVIDLEHSQLSNHEATLLVRHAHALSLPALVRFHNGDASTINRFLEAGAAGIQASSIASAAQASALRDATRYAPHGSRSISAAQPAANYGAVSLANYVASEAASPPLIIGQIESASCEDPLTTIAAALDVVFVGVTDLSLDLGVPGELSHQLVIDRCAEIFSAAQEVDTTFGGWAADERGCAALIESGAKFVVVGSDLQFLQSKTADVASLSRAAMKEVGT